MDNTQASYTTVNLIQQLCAGISGVANAPMQDKYPARADTMRLPIAVTTEGEGTFRTINRGSTAPTNEATISYTVTFLVEKLGQANMADMRGKVHKLLDATRAKFLDDASYINGNRYVLSESPTRIELMPREGGYFNTTGYRVLEYPLGADDWFHGFELSFTALITWPVVC